MHARRDHRPDRGERVCFICAPAAFDEASARELLLLAFAGECLVRMKSEPVRDYLSESFVQNRLPEEIAVFNGERSQKPEGAGRKSDERLPPMRFAVGSRDTRTFDVQKIRADFPILSRQVHGKPLVYLDNAATTQKPQAVIDAHCAATTPTTTPTSIAACTCFPQAATESL